MSAILYKLRLAFFLELCTVSNFFNVVLPFSFLVSFFLCALSLSHSIGVHFFIYFLLLIRFHAPRPFLFLFPPIFHYLHFPLHLPIFRIRCWSHSLSFCSPLLLVFGVVAILTLIRLCFNVCK